MSGRIKMLYLEQVKDFISSHKEGNLFNLNVFVKSPKGEFLLSNDKMASVAGMSSSEILGKTDNELCWKDCQLPYLEDDMMCVNNQKIIMRAEKIFAADKKFYQLLTLKKPVLLSFGGGVGIAAFSVFTDDYEDNQHFDIMNYVNNYFHSNLNFDNGQLNSILKSKPIVKPFSKRELQCAYYLCLGLTCTEIASLIFLSDRTVEDHVASLKRKLDVNSRSELVRNILKNNIIQTDYLTSLAKIVDIKLS